MVVLKSARKPTSQKKEFILNISPCFYTCFSILAGICLSLSIYLYMSLIVSLSIFLSFSVAPLTYFLFVEQILSLLSLPASLSLRLCLAICLSAVSHFLCLYFSLSPSLFLFLFFASRFFLCIFFL